MVSTRRGCHFAGHVGASASARFTLAHKEKERCGRTDRAVKHLIIAAIGCDYSMKALKQCHENGEVDDDKFAPALHSHKTAVDAMKSPQREEQANFDRPGGVVLCGQWINEPMLFYSHDDVMCSYVYVHR